MSHGLRKRLSIKGPFFATLALVGVSSADAQSWRITPSVSVHETLTDNFDLAPDPQKESDLITQVVPGLSIEGTGARARLSLNYRMQNILYARHSSQNRVQNYLSALGTLEAVENWLFIDASASITQQSISAFGVQPTPGEASANDNRAETRTYRLSPYIRGRFGTTGDYQLRYSWTESSARGNALSDVASQRWIGAINSGTGFSKWGWGVDGLSESTHYDSGRPDVDITRFRGSLIYQFDPELRFTTAVGHEKYDFGLVTRDGTTYGGGFDWNPSPRTQASAYVENRTFGNFHTINLAHRTARTVWRYIDRQEVTTLPSQLAILPAGTAFDLLFNALASQFPDPIARTAEAQRLLQQQGIPPDLLLPGTFLTTRVIQQRSRELSVALLGATNTVTLAARQTNSEAITAAVGAADDFSTASEIEQRGLSANWAHRVSPLSSLSLFASRIESKAASTSGLETTQWLIRALLTRQLSPKASASLGLRYRDFDGSAGSDFREKAITASLAVTF